MEKRDRNNNVMLWGGILLMLVMMAGYLLPDKEISLSERRYLAKMPKLSVTNVMSGSYMEAMENYLSDHMPGREAFRKLYMLTNEKFFLKQEINGYVRKKQEIYRVEESISIPYIDRNAACFQQIREKFFPSNPCYYAVIPDKNYYLESPCGYERFDYELQYRILEEKLQSQLIDLQDCLSQEDYYRTDLHWKQECLYKVKERLLQAMGNQTQTEEAYQQCIATRSFNGSYLLASGYHVEPDVLCYVQNETLQKVKVFDYEKQKEAPVYALDRVGQGDDYDIFLGGARALLTIENEESSSDKELIMFRDSYASSLAPLLTEAYRKITLVDLRYTTPDYALRQITWDEDTQVLFMLQAMTWNGNVFR